MDSKSRNTNKLKIDCDFPGGNIIIDAVNEDVVYLHQDLRDTEAFWFYWYFRVRNAGGRTLSFVFTQGDVIGSRGPAISFDKGMTWAWLGTEALSTDSRGACFKYRFTEDWKEVRFCFTIPYLESHLNAFLVQYLGNPFLQLSTLCYTRKGRAAEELNLGCIDGSARYRVLLTSRHHACESIANYVLEGVMTEILRDSTAGEWLRENIEFMIVPFVDKDGVEDGDQGKLRRPRDHNRDYEGDSIYETTKTLRSLIPKWSAGKLRVAIDVHCPYIKGDNNEVIFFVGGPDEDNWTRVTLFTKLLEDIQIGPLTYTTADNLPYGQSWNVESSEGQSFSRWVVNIPEVHIATSAEIPYANVGRQIVTADAARAFGVDVARAIHRFLLNMDQGTDMVRW
jgi:hypothetical protein